VACRTKASLDVVIKEPGNEHFRTFSQDEFGAIAIESGLIAALISVVISGAATAIGGMLTDVFTTIAAKLSLQLRHNSSGLL